MKNESYVNSDEDHNNVELSNDSDGSLDEEGSTQKAIGTKPPRKKGLSKLS